MSDKKKEQLYKKAKLEAKIAKLKAKILKFDKLDLSAHNEDASFEEGLKIANEIKEVLIISKGGLVLTAPQIGYNKNILVIRPIVGDQKNCKIIINPKVLDLSKQNNTQIEGCLSYPGFSKNVKRQSFISVEYINENGQKIIQSFDPWRTRCIKGGIDILNGKSEIKEAYLQNDKKDKFAQKEINPMKVSYVSINKGGSKNGIG